MGDTNILKEDKDYKGNTIHAFANVFTFLDFCFNNNYTPNNSITYYNKDEETIYITKINK